MARNGYPPETLTYLLFWEGPARQSRLGLAGRLRQDESGLPRRPPDQFLDSHVLCWSRHPNCHRSTRRPTAYVRQGSPCPVVSPPPSSCTCKSLPVDHLVPQGLLPRRCDQDHLPRSVRFGCNSERLCDRRRPRLHQPVAALTSGPAPRHTFSFFPCLAAVQQHFPSSLFPGESP